MDTKLIEALKKKNLFKYFKELEHNEITANTIITWIFVTDPVRQLDTLDSFRFIASYKPKRETHYGNYQARLETLGRAPLFTDTMVLFFDVNDHHPIKKHILDSAVHTIPDMHDSVLLKQGFTDNIFGPLHICDHMMFLATELLPYLTSIDPSHNYHTREDLIGKKNMDKLSFALKEMDNVRKIKKIMDTPLRTNRNPPTAPIHREDVGAASEAFQQNPYIIPTEFSSPPEDYKSLDAEQPPYYGANDQNSLYPDLFSDIQTLPRAVAMNSVFRRLTPIFPINEMVDVNTCDLMDFLRYHRFPSFSPVNMLNYETLGYALNDMNNIDEIEAFDAMVGYLEREVLVEGWVVEYMMKRSQMWRARTVNKVDPKVELEKQLKEVIDSLNKLVNKVEDITGIDKLASSINQIHEILISSGKASIRVLKPTIPENLLNPIKADEGPAPSTSRGGKKAPSAFDNASRFIIPQSD